ATRDHGGLFRLARVVADPPFDLAAEHAARGGLEGDHHLDPLPPALAPCPPITPHPAPRAPLYPPPPFRPEPPGRSGERHGAHSGAEKFASVHGHDRSPVKRCTPAWTISEHRCSRKTTPGRCTHCVCATPLCDSAFAPR